MRMTKLLSVPVILIQWSEIVKLVVEVWIIDMQLMRVDSNDGPS